MALRAAAARAHVNRHAPKPTCEVLNDDASTPDTAGPIAAAAAAPGAQCNLPEVTEPAPECSCGYDGGVNVDVESDDEYIPDSEHDSDSTDSDLSELTDLAFLSKPTPFEELTQKKTSKEWKELESNRSLGYNGLSVRKGYQDKANAKHRQEVNQSVRAIFGVTDKNRLSRNLRLMGHHRQLFFSRHHLPASLAGVPPAFLSQDFLKRYSGPHYTLPAHFCFNSSPK
ncbi:hypothetical protein B0H14DRAFT_2566573 [Mycena olivaceomarginata]|nr:hypothetical protein B0H14DRAFT_2566573 [Mycena olivaceomarginata]